MVTVSEHRMDSSASTGMSAADLPAPAFDLRGEAAPYRRLVSDLAGSVELTRMLARKEFFVRYRRASFGVLWSVFLPLVQAVVLAVVLGRFTTFATGHTYVVFVFAGTIAWNFFSAGLTGGVGSIVDNSGLSSKIYFPRLVFPLMTVLSGLYGTVVSIGVLLVFTYVEGARPGFRMLLIVPALLLGVLLTSALGALLGAVQVYFRDVRWIVSAAQLPWFYITPVVYPLSAVGRLSTLVEINPASGLVELFRAATVGADPGSGAAVAWSVGWTVALVVAAFVIHRRYDRVLVDLL